MKKYRNHTATTSRNLYLKKNIARSRRRAKLVGLLYLVGVIAMAALACLPLLTHELAPIGVTEFYKVFLSLDLSTATGITKTVNCALYAIILLVAVINALRGLGKLGWLFKKKGNKEHGFNRNAYAMEDLGRLFSASFVCLLINYVLIGVLCGGFIDIAATMMYIALAVGVVIHLLCGFIGAKVRYYDLENGQIVEQKRLVGRFACLVRNVLQIVVVLAIIYFLDFAGLGEVVATLLGDGESQMSVLVFGLQMLIVLSSFVLIKHAMSLTEYSMEGVYGSGMKNFRIFVFLAFIGAAGAFALCTMNKLETGNLLYIAIVCLVSFIIELVMRKYPRLPETMEELKNMKGEGEFSFDTLARIQQEKEQVAIKTQQPTVII